VKPAMSFLSGLVLLSACDGVHKARGPVTYYLDIKPLVDGKCVRCHQQDGIAPFTLVDYEDVKAHSGFALLAIDQRIMPPWKAAAGCNDYLGDFSLSDDEIQLFHDWVEQGTLEGDPAAEGAPIVIEGQGLSRVDVALHMPVAYTPSQAGPDDYRCFLLDWPAEYTTTQFISGFRAVPGDAGTVHHVIAFLASPDQVATYEALDAAEDGPGYTCFGGTGGPSTTWVGAWAPGSEGVDLPEGTGIAIDPGSVIVLQVHYNTIFAPAVPDQTAVEFKVESTVDRQVHTQPWANPLWPRGEMPIPAHEPDVAHWFEFDLSIVNGLRSLEIHSTALHMHNLGTRGTLRVHRASGAKECLLAIDDWDFHWQGVYALREAVRFDPGDQLYLECHWDNTQQNQVIVNGEPVMPVDVNWGEGSTDEMCLGVVLWSLPK
jgi:hypothetical protein